MNPYSGELEIDLGFATVTARFTWAVLAKIQADKGDDWLTWVTTALETNDDVYALAEVVAYASGSTLDTLLNNADPPGGIVAVRSQLNQLWIASFLGKAKAEELKREASPEGNQNPPIAPLMSFLMSIAGRSGRASATQSG